MKNAIIVSLLAAAGSASAQLNRGFELGDLTGFAIHDGTVSHSTVIQSALDQGPSQGQHFAHLTAGSLHQSEAAAVLDVMQSRLGDLYIDLGGTLAPDWGDYNVLAVDVPAGNYRFDYMFQSNDASTDYLDHAFVVNGAGQITVLASSLDQVTEWTETTVYHPGGQFFFVCANGGDYGVDANLYLDDTYLFDIDNGSFEAGFNEWSVDDGGAGHVQIVNQAIGGYFPTTGLWYARLTAGELGQLDAEQVMGLDAGTLANLYTDVGGEGNAFAGDYSILHQPIGGTSVAFDFAFTTPNAGSDVFLDHAFVVDSEGNITVLASSLDQQLTWERVVIDHPGGELFLVSANGGHTNSDANLYLDTFRDGPRQISSATGWEGMVYLATWSDGGFTTFGQVIESDRRQALASMKFYVEETTDEVIEYRAYVYEWDGEKIVGEALFDSGDRMTDDESEGGEPVLIETPGVVLEKDRCYVGFLTKIGAGPSGQGKFGYANIDAIDGMGVSSVATSMDELGDTPWSTVGETDLAVEFEMAALESQVVPTVNGFGEGISSQNMPWGLGGDIRYQQLYHRTEFASGAQVIDSIAFRVNAVGQSFEPVVFDAQIWLGHADVALGNMHPAFDDNFTLDKVLVHSGPLELSSAGLGGFDIVIDIDDFAYDPGDGNLLMELVLPDGQPSVPQFDAAGTHFFQGDTIWTDRLFAASANAETGLSSGVDGLVTRFNVVETDGAYDADCNADGEYNILDFVCFQLAFEAGDMEIADCDGNGVLNILDFVCFQQAFVAACD